MNISHLRAATIFSGFFGAALLLLAGYAVMMPLCAAATCAALLISELLEDLLE